MADYAPHRGLADVEANVPAEQAQPKAYSRLSKTHEHARRAEGAEEPPSQGSAAPDCDELPEVAVPGEIRGRAERGHRGASHRALDRNRSVRARKGRIRKRAEFQEVQLSGRKIVSTNFVLLLRARASNAEARGPRLGVTASRKIGNAIVRNRAKRLIREGFRKTSELWPPDIDLVVIARRPLTGLKLGVVVAEWRALEPLVRRRTEQARRDRDERELALAKAALAAQTGPENGGEHRG